MYQRCIHNVLTIINHSFAAPRVPAFVTASTTVSSKTFSIKVVASETS